MVQTQRRWPEVSVATISQQMDELLVLTNSFSGSVQLDGLLQTQAPHVISSERQERR